MKSRLLLLLLFLGFGAIAIGWVFESSEQSPQEKASLLIPDDIDYFLTNMHYREMNAKGELDFEFQSPRLEHYPLNDVSSIEQPSMQIYGNDPWLVDSLSGEFQHRTEILHLTRQVVMQKQGASPMQVYGESIHFEPNRNRITADSDILMINPRGRINAERAVFDLARKIYRFTRARTVYNHEKS
jgi:lipopolysaccharide export system protein LptC